MEHGENREVRGQKSHRETGERMMMKEERCMKQDELHGTVEWDD